MAKLVRTTVRMLQINNANKSVASKLGNGKSLYTLACFELAFRFTEFGHTLIMQQIHYVNVKVW